MSFLQSKKIMPNSHQKLHTIQVKQTQKFLPLKIVKDGKIFEIQGNIQKYQLYLKFANEIFIIQLSFWYSFQPIENDQSSKGFILKLKTSEHYIFYVKNLQQLNIWKSKFSKIIVIKGFYNDYKPLKKIGQGKSASVFLARHRDSGQSVAIKAFSKILMQQDPISIKALENQIKILRRINSANLITFQSFYETDKSYYLITKYIEGTTLRNLIEFQHIQHDKIMQIFKKMLFSLNQLSKNGIVHRDLKPQNIIIERHTQRIVIVDFGLALLLEQPKQNLYVHCGTPGFIAPEILDENNYEVNIKSDIFSLGIIFHLMLLKKFPYKKASLDNIVQQNRQANFQMSNMQYQLISTQAKTLLLRMLAKNPRQRISSEQLIQYFQHKQNRTRQSRISPIYDSIYNQNEKILSWISNKKDSHRSSSMSPININIHKGF